MAVKLVPWDTKEVYDRLGLDEKFYVELEKNLGVRIPYLEIPVKQGRNIALIIETAAKNFRLQSRGYYSALEFNKSVLKWLETTAAEKEYFTGDDSY
jgi:HPr kinase/phosphorylase